MIQTTAVERLKIHNHLLKREGTAYRHFLYLLFHSQCTEVRRHEQFGTFQKVRKPYPINCDTHIAYPSFTIGHSDNTISFTRSLYLQSPKRISIRWLHHRSRNVFGMFHRHTERRNTSFNPKCPNFLRKHTYSSPFYTKLYPFFLFAARHKAKYQQDIETKCKRCFHCILLI